jgi:Trk K+ transport system NAD-binding subunit
MAASKAQKPDLFVVCGLGSLGQSCVSVLKEFGVRVNAIEAIEHQQWEIPELPDLLDCLLVGDCRQPQTLEKVGIRECRAILLVTSNEQINLAAAFTARSLNPQVRLIIRSAEENLNQLLSQQLGNFVAFEANQLPASSFALAALGGEIRGLFNLENRRLRVIQLDVNAQHPWCDRRQLHDLNTQTRRLLTYSPRTSPAQSHANPPNFNQWNPNVTVQAGDRISYVEITDHQTFSALQSTQSPTPKPSAKTKSGKIIRQYLADTFSQAWQRASQTQRVAVVSSGVMLTLFGLGIKLYQWQYPELEFQAALNTSLVLALGNFGDVYAQIETAVPWWLYFYSLCTSIAGTLFIGILYALLTERVLAARFQFMKRRPPIPKANHIVLIGLGQVGQRVASLLQDLQRSLVGLDSSPLDAEVLPQMPLVFGNLKQSLELVNLEAAQSIIVMSDNEVTNLEIGLMTRAVNPSCNLVIRIFDPGFAKNVAQLLPGARVIGVYALAAEAFSAAAFGENIVSLFRLHNRTTLVTEYSIESEDSLQGQLLAEVAYGYAVIPIFHRRGDQQSGTFMPSDDIRLQAGDRLVILGTINGLQQIEQGNRQLPRMQVRIERAVSEEARFEGAGAIARICGCELGVARSLMSQFPATVPHLLYWQQAQRLMRELSKIQVAARLESSTTDTDHD